MITSATIVEISKAILKAQKEMANPLKLAKNPFFKSNYCDLNTAREACIPALNENGISLLQPIVQENGKNYVQTMLLHESGEFISSLTEIVCAKQNDPQAMGSGISYSRRYGLMALLGLAADDDDSEAAMGRGIVQKVPEKKIESKLETKELKESEEIPTFSKRKKEVKTKDTEDNEQGW